MPPRYLYKILDQPPPETLPETLPATDLDNKDGFIHLSTAEQTLVTATLFFKGHNDLWILKLETQALDGRVEFSTDPNAGIENGCAHVHESLKGLGRDNVVGVIHAHRGPQEQWAQVKCLGDLEGDA